VIQQVTLAIAFSRPNYYNGECSPKGI